MATAKKKPAAQKSKVTKKKPEFNGGRAVHEAQVGHFAEAVTGDHSGRYGVLDNVSVDKYGVPTTGVLRTRDSRSERLVVNYSDLRPARAGRR